MAFAFARKESVNKAVCRLVCNRIERAVECLQANEKSEGIHGVRKSIKKVRSILRLVRKVLGKRAYRREVKALRKAANLVAGVRDAHVTLQALDKLSKHFESKVQTGHFAAIRKLLRQRAQTAVEQFFSGDSPQSVHNILSELEKRCATLKVQATGWSALAPGIKRSYACARKALCAVQSDPTPENYHEWRKRMKDLWYQLRLLEPIWPRQMKALANDLRDLTEWIGDDHDLFVLQQVVGKSSNLPSQEVDTLNKLIDQRHRKLRKKALKLGKIFFSEKPSDFTRRLATHWKTWR